MAGHRLLRLTAWTSALSGLLLAPAHAAPPQWENVPVPPLGGLALPMEVAAAGPRAAWASGLEDMTTGQKPFMLAWNGREWRRQALPLPNSAVVKDIAAAGPRDAWALAEGPGEEGAGKRALALHWNGTAWREVGYPAGVLPTMPSPLPYYSEVVSAPRGGPAWSVGHDARAGQSVALRFQDGRWERQRLPVRMTSASTVGVRSAKDVWISCICDLPGSGPTQAMLHWNGVRWKTVRHPVAEQSHIAKIVPVSATSVWAYRAGTSASTPSALLHWNGTGWKEAAIPTPPCSFSIPTLADDGRKGAWVSVSLPDGPGYLHYNGGRWTTEGGSGRPMNSALVYDLARVPGTRTLWSVGLANPLNGPAFVERRR
ncbi:hypothetical protein ACIBF1_37775 [Spirillospora sp. NPDC050679]